jgi:hypothetical protein
MDTIHFVDDQGLLATTEDDLQRLVYSLSKVCNTVQYGDLHRKIKSHGIKGRNPIRRYVSIIR